MDYQHGIAARTVWAEARGEGWLGLTAVEHVIFNRLKAGRWGSSLAAICLYPFAFSCWNAADANRKPIANLVDGDPLVQQCLGAVMAVEAGQDDPTKGSLFYKVVGTTADWAIGHTPVIVIGHHEFFNDVA